MVWSKQPSKLTLICVDYLSHFRLGLSSLVFEHETNDCEPRIIAT